MMCLGLEEVIFLLNTYIHTYITFFTFFFFQEGFMVMKFLNCKNDQLRKGYEVIISQMSSPAWPFCAGSEVLIKLLYSKNPVFRPISRRKGCCKLVAPDKPISYSTIRNSIYERLGLVLGRHPKIDLFVLLLRYLL